MQGNIYVSNCDAEPGIVTKVDAMEIRPSPSRLGQNIPEDQRNDLPPEWLDLRLRL